MSLNKNALDVVKVIPPPLEIDKKPYKADGTFQAHQFQAIPPSSGADDATGGMEFSVNPP